MKRRPKEMVMLPRECIREGEQYLSVKAGYRYQGHSDTIEMYYVSVYSMEHW